MKLIFLILVVVACTLAAVTPEQKAKIEPISKQCREKYGVTIEQVNKIRNNGIIEDDPKLKKHIFCFLEKTGLMTESGDINTADIKSKLKKQGVSDEVISQVETECFKKEDSNEETAYHLAKCLFGKKQDFSVVD